MNIMENSDYCNDVQWITCQYCNMYTQWFLNDLLTLILYDLIIWPGTDVARNTNKHIVLTLWHKKCVFYVFCICASLQKCHNHGYSMWTDGTQCVLNNCSRGIVFSDATVYLHCMISSMNTYIVLLYIAHCSSEGRIHSVILHIIQQ